MGVAGAAVTTMMQANIAKIVEADVKCILIQIDIGKVLVKYW
jgi:hypothetical protein